MPDRRYVVAVRKDDNDVIVGVFGPPGTWGYLSREDVVSHITNNEFDYFTYRKGMRSARISTVTQGDRRFLRTNPDRNVDNNVDEMPRATLEDLPPEGRPLATSQFDFVYYSVALSLFDRTTIHAFRDEIISFSASWDRKNKNLERRFSLSLEFLLLFEIWLDCRDAFSRRQFGIVFRLATRFIEKYIDVLPRYLAEARKAEGERRPAQIWVPEAPEIPRSNDTLVRLQLSQEKILRLDFPFPGNPFVNFFNFRSQSTSLDELSFRDWKLPLETGFRSLLGPQDYYTDLQSWLPSEPDELSTPVSYLNPVFTWLHAPTTFLHSVVRHLNVHAAVFAPILMAEARFAQGKLQAALSIYRYLSQLEFNSILVPGSSPTDNFTLHPRFPLLTTNIEAPFVKLRIAQCHLSLGDQFYKAGVLDKAQDGYGRAITEIQKLSDDLGTGLNYSLQARAASRALENEAASVLGGPVSLSPQDISEHTRKTRLLNLDPFHLELPQNALGFVERDPDTIPGLQTNLQPHRQVISPVPENSALLHSIAMRAQAGANGILYGFNFIGYRDDYVPPLRFSYLLDRARYFSQQAKNAQRDYLNMLRSAEQEDLQERSAGHAVVLQKNAIRLETARVQQASLELGAAQESSALAQLSESNARTRLANFRDFDAAADDLERKIRKTGRFQAFVSTLQGATQGATSGAAAGAPGAIAGAISGGLLSGSQAFAQQRTSELQLRLQDRQREYEKQNLGLATVEAAQATVVAEARADVAAQGVTVSALQRSAAMLQHEFAVQSLEFLRARTLNSDAWYRIADTVRDIADGYLNYAIELAFLAEQAYEFEADRRVDLIRFDYAESEVGDFLAADFLLQDLDTLEHQLIVSQKERRQPLQYIVSMARDYPMALQELEDNGQTTFNLTLADLERRFPGFYNIQIAQVADVQVLALMDRSRFSVRLTHLGSSQMRLQGNPASPISRPLADSSRVAAASRGATAPGPFKRATSAGRAVSWAQIERDAPALHAAMRDEEQREVARSSGDGESVETQDRSAEFDDSRESGDGAQPNEARIVAEKRIEVLDAALARRTNQETVSGERRQPTEQPQSRRVDESLAVRTRSVASDLDDLWPVYIRTSEAHTAAFSGLTLQERRLIADETSPGARQDFAGLGAAAAWQLDMSLEENRVVPDSIADVQIVFHLHGYHDRALETVVRSLGPRPEVPTKLLSASLLYPDAFYEFHNSRTEPSVARMSWDVPPEMLSLRGGSTKLRNLGFLVNLQNTEVQFGLLSVQYEFDLELAIDGTLIDEKLHELPDIRIAFLDVLQVRLNASRDGSELHWDFGDGAPPRGNQNTIESVHTFLRPGRHTLTLVERWESAQNAQQVRERRYTIALIVPNASDRGGFSADLIEPVIQARRLDDGSITLSLNARQISSGESVAAEFTLNGSGTISQGTQFVLPPGRHRVSLFARGTSSKLRARLTSRQKGIGKIPLEFDGLRLTTNSDQLQSDWSTLTEYLFQPGQSVSAADDWAIEFHRGDNHALASFNAQGTEVIDVEEIDDLSLLLEYEFEGASA